jgi:VanZ family protein
VASDDTGAGWVEPKYATVAAGIVALILYGSLFPFQFHMRPGTLGSVTHFLATRHSPMDRGDLISNVLLYLPLGIFCAGSLCRLSRISSVLLATLFGLTLSTTIELAQFYDLTRASELWDTCANAAGSFMGAILGVFLRRDWFPRPSRGQFAVLLIAIWFGYELFPYAPVFDPLRYAALAHAFRSPRFPSMELLGRISFWLAVAVLLEALLGVARSRSALVILVACVLLTRLVNLVLLPIDVAGALIATAAWFALSRLATRVPLIASLFLAFAILQALQPFKFLPVPRHFGWTPFLAFINGPRLEGTRSFLEKSFTYGALLWLWTRAGLPWAMVTVAVALLELGLRFAQTWLPGRSAEITDAIMVLILAAVMKLVDESVRRDVKLNVCA